MRTAHALATCLLLAAMPAAAGDQQAPVSAAQFYVVGADGRSVPDPAIRRIVPPPRRAAPPAKRPATKSRTVVRVHEQPGQQRDDAMAADRCERFGFFYTADGRCVIAPRALRQSRK